MATNTKSARDIQAEWDLVTSSYIDGFNAVSHVGRVASSVTSFAQQVEQTKTQHKPDKAAVEAIIQSENPSFEKIKTAIDEASGSYITKPPAEDTTKTQSAVSYRTGVFANFHQGSRFNWFTGGTNLTYTDGPTVNSYVGSRALWQKGDSFYQDLMVNKYIGNIATDTYVSSINADQDIDLCTKSKEAIITSYREAVAIHNINMSAQSSTVDVTSLKADVSVSGLAGSFQFFGAKTEVKAGGYACDMKIWPKMDEFRIGLLGYTLWDIGSLSVKNSITGMAMNNYMGVFCSFANEKVDVSTASVKTTVSDFVSSRSSVSAKLNQVRKVTSFIENAMLTASEKKVEVKKVTVQSSEYDSAFTDIKFAVEEGTANVIKADVVVNSCNLKLFH